jgi:integrase
VKGRSVGCTTSSGPLSNGAERLDLIARNPAAKVDRPRGAKPDITPPTPADVVRMIAEASPALALFLRLAALTGARRGQLCGLHWADIDLDGAAVPDRRRSRMSSRRRAITYTSLMADGAGTLDPRWPSVRDESTPPACHLRRVRHRTPW